MVIGHGKSLPNPRSIMSVNLQYLPDFSNSVDVLFLDDLLAASNLTSLKFLTLDWASGDEPENTKAFTSPQSSLDPTFHKITDLGETIPAQFQSKSSPKDLIDI